MSIESIESMALSFDNELKQLETLSNSSPLHRSPHHRKTDLDLHIYDPGYGLPEHSFELAAAESERERLYDKLNHLLARVDELELHSRHQENMLNHLKKRNKELETKLYHSADSTVGDGPTSLDTSVSSQDDVKDVNNSMSRLHYKSLELELQETKLVLSQSQKKLQDTTQARDNLSTEYQDELSKRVHAEKQRDAYAAAYQKALQHIEKWSS